MRETEENHSNCPELGKRFTEGGSFAIHLSLAQLRIIEKIAKDLDTCPQEAVYVVLEEGLESVPLTIEEDPDRPRQLHKARRADWAASVEGLTYMEYIRKYRYLRLPPH